MSHINPYLDLTEDEIYEGLMSGRFGVKWPNEDLQKGYAGTNKKQLVRRAFAFLKILEDDGAFKKKNFKGLDYGCGWGRFASTMLKYGPPSKFDLCDAWQVTLNHISQLNYKNEIFKVPSLLKENDIPKNKYDFILSFSVFTHISPKSFDYNIPVLLDALKKNGNLYLTVRHDDFIDHKYSSKKTSLLKKLNKDGFVFLDSGGDQNKEKLFGDMIVTPEYISTFAKSEYLGKPHSLQHVYKLTKKTA